MVGSRVAERLKGGELVWQIADVVLSVIVNTYLFALLFKPVPDIRIRWRDVWAGAFFTSLLFVIGKVGLALWLGKGSIASTFGAAASVLILLVWIYYSSLIFFFGVALVSLQMAWQVTTLDIRDPANCLRRFRSNRDVGAATRRGGAEVPAPR